MSVESQIESVVIAKIEAAVADTEVRAWTDATQDEGAAQVVVKAEPSEIMSFDENGKAMDRKYQIKAMSRTYIPEDEDLAIINALHASVFAAVEALASGDFSGLTCLGTMSELEESSFDERFNMRISSKSLIVSM